MPAGAAGIIELVAGDADLIRKALIEVLESEGTTGKHMQAKAQAARQLGLLTGLIKSADEAAAAAVDGEQAEDPFADLHSEFERYQARRRRRAA